MKAHRTINIGLVTFCAVTLAMIASAANADIVTWTFQGNEYSGTGDDLAGEVTVTLDDEGTSGSVNVLVDATALPASATDSISALFFNMAEVSMKQVSPEDKKT